MTNKTMEEILDRSTYGLFTQDTLRSGILAAMTEWGKQRFEEGRDNALDWAAEHAYCKPFTEGWGVSTPSILSGKTSNDLQP